MLRLFLQRYIKSSLLYLMAGYEYATFRVFILSHRLLSDRKITNERCVCKMGSIHTVLYELETLAVLMIMQVLVVAYAVLKLVTSFLLGFVMSLLLLDFILVALRKKRSRKAS